MRVRRAIGALAVLPVVAACYTYVPVTSLEPVPGTRVSLVLNDQGRLESARQIGPYAVRVEGALLQSTNQDYLLQVSDVVDIRGARNKWMGETVPLPRSYVATTYERKFSRGRSLFLAAGLVSVVASFVVGFDLLGFARGTEGGGPPGPDPDDQ